MVQLQKRTGYVRNMARKILSQEYKILNEDCLPINIEKIARNLGFEIQLLDRMEDHHSALILKIQDVKLIGLNKKHHIHRRRFSLGHELGHYILDHPPEEDCKEDEIKIFNQEADEFAGELLVPYQLLKELIHSNSIDELSKLFLVSRDVIIIRAQNTRLFSYLR